MLKISNKKENIDYTVFSIRIDKDIRVKLEDLAKKTNRSRNQIIQICLKYALDNIEVE